MQSATPPVETVGGLAHNRTIKQFGDTPTKSPRPRRTRATKGERKLHRSVSATRTITHLVCAAKRLNRRETRVAHPARPLCETSARKVIHDTTLGRKAHTNNIPTRERTERSRPDYRATRAPKTRHVQSTTVPLGTSGHTHASHPAACYRVTR